MTYADVVSVFNAIRALAQLIAKGEPVVTEAPELVQVEEELIEAPGFGYNSYL